MRKFLDFYMQKKSFERLFAEQFSDMDIESTEALESGDTRLAQWIKIRGHLLLFATVVDHALSSTVYRVLRSIIGPPGGA